eukprot:2512244-Rhodomonas_salina.1
MPTFLSPSLLFLVHCETTASALLNVLSSDASSTTTSSTGHCPIFFAFASAVFGDGACGAEEPREEQKRNADSLTLRMAAAMLSSAFRAGTTTLSVESELQNGWRAKCLRQKLLLHSGNKACVLACFTAERSSSPVSFLEAEELRDSNEVRSWCSD